MRIDFSMVKGNPIPLCNRQGGFRICSICHRNFFYRCTYFDLPGSPFKFNLLFSVYPGPGSCNYLEPLSYLIEDVCEVIMFDPKGCGRSSYYGNGYDIDSALHDLERIREEYGYTKWIVIGHSWGADLGLAYSMLFPQSMLGYVSTSGSGRLSNIFFRISFIFFRTSGSLNV